MKSGGSDSASKSWKELVILTKNTTGHAEEQIYRTTCSEADSESAGDRKCCSIEKYNERHF